MLTIKRAVLLQLMDSKDWTQANLARKTQISTRTLTKICSGSSDEPKVRWSNIEKIAKFLGVAPDVLTGEQELPTQHKAVSSTPGVVTTRSARMDSATHLAFDLIAHRYGASFQDVLKVAPLLFAMHAELAMAEVDWSEISDDWYGDVDNVLDYDPLFGGLPLLAEEFWDPSAGRTEDGYYESYTRYNPMNEHLYKVSQQAEIEGVVRIHGNKRFPLNARYSGRLPAYEVCPDELEAITLGDRHARRALESGSVHLKDIPAELMAYSRGEERVSWLAERAPKLPGHSSNIPHSESSGVEHAGLGE